LAGLDGTRPPIYLHLMTVMLPASGAVTLTEMEDVKSDDHTGDRERERGSRRNLPRECGLDSCGMGSSPLTGSCQLGTELSDYVKTRRRV
jgi:hypothetical protein